MEIADPAVAGIVISIYMVLLAAGTLIAIVLLMRSRNREIPWQELSASLQARPWSWQDASIVLGCQIGLLATAILASALLEQPSKTVLLLVETALFDGAGLILLYGYLRLTRRSWLAVFGNPSVEPLKQIRLATLFYLAILPVVFFSALVSQGILSLNGYPPSLQEIVLLLSGDNPLWMRFYLVFLATFLAPTMEECIFRGLVLPLLARRLGTAPAIVTTSVLFAAIHFHMPSFIPLCIMATGFSLAYLYSRSLWVPIVMHALCNGVNILLLYCLYP